MVEVFKTNVYNRHQANRLLQSIHNKYSDYQANFDLEDCDNILRIKSSEPVQTSLIVELFHQYGFRAEALPDDHGAVHAPALDALAAGN